MKLSNLKGKNWGSRLSFCDLEFNYHLLIGNGKRIGLCNYSFIIFKIKIAAMKKHYSKQGFDL